MIKMDLAQHIAIGYLRAKLNFIGVFSKRKAARKAMVIFSTPYRKTSKKMPDVFKKGEPLAFGDGCSLVQYRTGEDHCTAGRRAVGSRSKLWKPQVAAIVIGIQIDRDREPPVGGALGCVVAMRTEEAAGFGVITGNQIAFDPRGPEVENFLDLGQQATVQASDHLLLKRFFLDDYV